MANYKVFTFWYTASVTCLSIIYATVAYFYVVKTSNFRWVQMMIGLCFLSNFFTLFFILVDKKENSAWQKEHPVLEGYLMWFAIWTLYGF